MAMLKLSSPWIIFYRMVQAFFRNDPDVNVIYDDDNNSLAVYVKDADKGSALKRLMPPDVMFGDKKMYVDVISNSPRASEDDLDVVIEKALKGNGALKYIHKAEGIFSFPATYVVFKNEVVQFFTDDLGDIFGYHSTLYENLAREIFVGGDGIFYCTDVPSDASKVGTQWP